MYKMRRKAGGGAIFCSSCGARIEQKTTVSKSKKKRKVCLAAAGVLALVCVCFIGKGFFGKKHEVIWSNGDLLCEGDDTLYYTAYGEVGSVSEDGEILEKFVTAEDYDTAMKSQSGVRTENLFLYEDYLYWSAYPGVSFNVTESEEEGGVFRVKTDGTGFEQLVSYPYPELGITSMGVIDGELGLSVDGVNACICIIQFGKETDEYTTLDGHTLVSRCGEFTEADRGEVVYADKDYLYFKEGRLPLDGGELEETTDCYEIPNTLFTCDISGKEMAVAAMDGTLGYYLWDEGKWCIFDKEMKETYGIDSFILSEGKAYGICSTEERVVVFDEDWNIEKVIEGIADLVLGCDIFQEKVFAFSRDEDTGEAVIRVYEDSVEASDVSDSQEEEAVAEEKSPLIVDASQGSVTLSGTLEWRVGEFVDTGMQKQMYILHLDSPISRLLYEDPDSGQVEEATAIEELDVLLPETVSEGDGRYDGWRVQVKGNIWPTFNAWYFNSFAMGVDQVIWEE